MGLDVLLILFGIIGQASTEEGEKLHEVAETCLEVGIGIVIAELLAFFIFWLLARP